MLARSLGLSTDAAHSKALLLEELERVLCEGRSRGEITAVVVDEAQSLSTELLEEIRLLANIETRRRSCCRWCWSASRIWASGSKDRELRQLKQRVALRCEIAPLSLTETATYIANRIETAGGVAARLFTREAVMRIHAFSGGIPRTISVVCDNSLINGLALGKKPVGEDLVLDVCRDFALGNALSGRGASRRQLLNGSLRPGVTDEDTPGDWESGGGDALDEAVAGDRRLRVLGNRRF